VYSSMGMSSCPQWNVLGTCSMLDISPMLNRSSCRWPVQQGRSYPCVAQGM
jgi:hypothetical protein